MNAHPMPSLTPRELVRLLAAERTLWIAPAVVCGLLAAAYSLVMPRYWDASQALVVRQETAGSRGPNPGKFADLYEMRTMQETILELAKSREVVVATLKAVDQRLLGAASEPDAEAVEKFRKRLKMLPPDGGEFGKSEIFYFTVKDPSRERAIELVGELCRQLETGLKALRAARAEGLTAELSEQVSLATQLHEQETKRLVEFEAEVGADLGELRMLHSASSGQSDLRQEAVQLEADVRKYQAQVRESEQLLVMLRAAERDPTQLVATPNSLLTSQPALRRLKEGLVDAQLATAKVAGRRSKDHPLVISAVDSENRVRSDLHRELVTAIRGAEAELQLAHNRVAATQALLQGLEARLGKLAERRAEYSNRVAAVDNSRVTLDRARQNLSTAKAALAAAKSGSLVTRIDQPETGPYPAGPGRSMVTMAGGVGGMMLGLALVFLKTTPTSAVRESSYDARHPSGDAAPRERRAAAAPAPRETKTPLVAERTVPPAPVEELWPQPANTPAVVIRPMPTSVVAAASPTIAAVAAPEPVEAPAPRLRAVAAVEVIAPLTPSIAVGELDETPELRDPREPESFALADSWSSAPAWPPVESPAQAADDSDLADADPISTNSWAVDEPQPTEQHFEPATTAVATMVAVETAPAAFAAAEGSSEELGLSSSEPYLEDALPVEAPAKRVLPTGAGTLPTAGGSLPSLAGAASYGGMSLQEALQAARQSFSPDMRG